MIYDPFCLNTSLSIIVNTITDHRFSLQLAFTPFQVGVVFLYGIEFNANRLEQLPIYIRKAAASTQKSDIFNLHSEPALCSERLDTILLLLLLSERGKALCLNASVLTSITTVSGIEKPSRQISFRTY